MDAVIVTALLKERLGIRSNARDTYLAAIADAVLAELDKQQGLALDASNPAHILFVADYAAWYYQSRDESGAMPRHLQFRLHNLIFETRRPTP